MLLMSPRTAVVCFFSVLVAFCSGLEFEDRGKCEMILLGNSNTFEDFDSAFSRTCVTNVLGSKKSDISY